MDSYEEKWEYKKGFDRGFSGKSTAASFFETALGFCGSMVGFERERNRVRERGFQAGVMERRMRKYYAGETTASTVLGMVGLDEENKDTGTGFEQERKKRGY